MGLERGGLPRPGRAAVVLAAGPSVLTFSPVLVLQCPRCTLPSDLTRGNRVRMAQARRWRPTFSLEFVLRCVLY